ncbi:DUF6989 domain-containing protein [Leptospira ryugenii]|nr:hypothetical protein [Leptospira ryugenii]
MKKVHFLEESFLFAYFSVFTIISICVLRFLDFSQGWKFFLLVLLFQISFPLVSLVFRFYNLFRIWLFLLPLSIMMVVPDWFLSGVLSVLVFPEDGFAKIGTVSAYMAGLWSIPLFVLVYTGIKLEERSVSIIGTCLWVAFLSVVVFGLSEAFSNELGSWYAQNVKMSYGIAHYVLVPEMILSVATYLAYQGFSTSPLWMQIPISFLIMVQYAGSLAVSYLFFEKIM